AIHVSDTVAGLGRDWAGCEVSQNRDGGESPAYARGGRSTVRGGRSLRAGQRAKTLPPGGCGSYHPQRIRRASNDVRRVCETPREPVSQRAVKVLSTSSTTPLS